MSDHFSKQVHKTYYRYHKAHELNRFHPATPVFDDDWVPLLTPNFHQPEYAEPTAVRVAEEDGFSVAYVDYEHLIVDVSREDKIIVADARWKSVPQYIKIDLDDEDYRPFSDDVDDYEYDGKLLYMRDPDEIVEFSSYDLPQNENDDDDDDDWD